MNALKLLLVLTCCCQLMQAGAYEFCSKEIQKKLCKKNPHYACIDRWNKTGIILEQVCPTTKRVRDTMLRSINGVRNKAAAGLYPGNLGQALPKAKRMRQLIWDWELAYLAHLLAIDCFKRKVLCLATKRFPLAMALTFSKTSPENLEYEKVINFVTNRTEISFGLFSQDDIEKFTAAYNTTLMTVNDQVSRMGGAVYKCRDPDTNSLYANFVYVVDVYLVKGDRVYQEGEPASNCDAWNTTKSDTWPNLCANTGRSFPIWRGQPT